MTHLLHNIGTERIAILTLASSIFFMMLLTFLVEKIKNSKTKLFAVALFIAIVHFSVSLLLVDIVGGVGGINISYSAIFLVAFYGLRMLPVENDVRN